uniref:Mitochondrial carrier protein n=1 Tax=Aureoumbra lagunensis TaxID=44058 RepID=A0A7S3JSJ4_9STRA|mmetsp:Transcript_9644/g.13371  ORF Transcript_9644/g.13371 Transcript_9644/m.13371 type:complete len:267 (-) Transcript_9644:86-886(-)
MKSDVNVTASAGIFSGIVGTLIGYPFDVCKTYMQANGSHDLLRTAMHIYKSDGISGLYRGVAAPLGAFTFLGAQTFPLFVYFDSKFYSPWLAGACCGPFSAMVSTPFELLKIQLALNGKEGSTRTAFTFLFKNPYLGHGINTVRESLFLGVYFGVYMKFRNEISIPLAGAAAGVTAWIISYPLDCVKTRVQRFGLPASKILFDLLSSSFSSTGNGANRTIRVISVGLSSLYSGFTPSILRAAFVSAVRFSSYEAALWFLSSPSFDK